MWYTGLVTETYKRKPNTKCKICNEPVYRRPAQIKNQSIFCSSICYGKSCRKEIPCPVCGKLLLSGLNKKTCSRECSNKNRTNIKYKIGRPNDKANCFRILKIRLLEKRGSFCERCNYNKYKILQIHHKNRKREDNSDKNLEIVCPNCHYEEHLL